MQQQPTPIDPRTILMAHLTAQEWSVVIEILRKQSYEMVAGIITSLGEQLTEQQQRSALSPPQK